MSLEKQEPKKYKKYHLTGFLLKYVFGTRKKFLIFMIQMNVIIWLHQHFNNLSYQSIFNNIGTLLIY